MRIKNKPGGYKEGFIDGYVTFKMQELNYEGDEDTVMTIVIIGNNIEYYSINDIEVISSVASDINYVPLNFVRGFRFGRIQEKFQDLFTIYY